jgi:hypothetical protein
MARLCHLQPDGYDTDSLIKVLDQLAVFYGIEAARPISDQGWGLLTAITPPRRGRARSLPAAPPDGRAAELSSTSSKASERLGTGSESPECRPS